METSITTSGATDNAKLLMQIVPLELISVALALVVFLTARKRGLFPWGWVVLTLTPFTGMVVAAIFFLFTFFSTLDRLNALEARLGQAAEA